MSDFLAKSKHIRRKKLYKQYKVEAIAKKTLNYLSWEIE